MPSLAKTKTARDTQYPVMSWSIATGGGSVEVLEFMRTILVTGAAMIKPSLEPRAA
jgi:hypothetical protein